MVDMIPEFKRKIAFRLSDDDRGKIERLVKDGKFKSKSSVVRVALKEFLQKEGVESVEFSEVVRCLFLTNL